jgi:hypothetical protein
MVTFAITTCLGKPPSVGDGPTLRATLPEGNRELSS